MPKVLFFGEIREVTGLDFWMLREVGDTASLLSEAENKWPELAKKNFVISVNRKISHDNLPLSESDEVAFLPPFSGG